MYGDDCITRYKDGKDVRDITIYHNNGTYDHFQFKLDHDDSWTVLVHNPTHIGVGVNATFRITRAYYDIAMLPDSEIGDNDILSLNNLHTDLYGSTDFDTIVISTPSNNITNVNHDAVCIIDLSYSRPLYLSWMAVLTVGSTLVALLLTLHYNMEHQSKKALSDPLLGINHAGRVINDGVTRRSAYRATVLPGTGDDDDDAYDDDDNA